MQHDAADDVSIRPARVFSKIAAPWRSAGVQHAKADLVGVGLGVACGPDCGAATEVGDAFEGLGIEPTTADAGLLAQRQFTAKRRAGRRACSTRSLDARSRRRCEAVSASR